MVQGRKSKDIVFTVSPYHDGIFICNPLRYVEGVVKQITDVNFDGMTFNDLREIVKCLVHGLVKVRSPLKSIKELKIDSDVDAFLLLGYKNRTCVDLYVEHHDYDVLDFLSEETSEHELFSASSDEYCSDGVNFHTARTIMNVDKYMSVGCYAKMKKDGKNQLTVAKGNVTRKLFSTPPKKTRSLKKENVKAKKGRLHLKKSMRFKKHVTFIKESKDTRSRKQGKGCSNVGGSANNGEGCSKDVGRSVMTSNNVTFIASFIPRASGLRPYHFTYPERRLTMEEMLYKFIKDGKREQEDMRPFIHEFRTTNELLFKERNNSLSGLMFEMLSGIIKQASIKRKGTGSFTIPYDIGQLHVNNALADLRASISLMPYTMYEKLDMPEDSRVPIILGKPFLATARAMIYIFNKKITLRVGDDEVIFDMDQSIKRPPTKDDECYGVDNLDGAINTEAHELLANNMSDSFLLKGLEKLIDQSDLESCESFECDCVDDSDAGEPIRHIDFVNTPYRVTQKTTEPDKFETEQLYLSSANEIDEKKLELKILPQRLESHTYMETNLFP
uniref:Splicing factor n=1 Tax=Tanacetum cinerariifolium TaxID=118510 RepID=A0A6L2NBV7_TANCI|nr:splicing factor [Tanacetum cinerariifolium]